MAGGYPMNLRDSSGNPISKTNTLPTVPMSITKTLRDSFQTLSSSVWTTVSTGGSNDIIRTDGNALGSSYLVLSKDPFDLGNEIVIESVARFTSPFEITFGAHLSQRTLGQEFAVEVVSDDTPTVPGEVAIFSISQTTTTLTVITSTPHNLLPGMRFGIYGCTDTRMNYASLVVSAIVSSTTFTATAGPGGTIGSLTVGPFTSGTVYQRSSMGYAPDGASLVFENTSSTNGSCYVRNDGGDSTPIVSTPAANHSLTIPSTTSIQVIPSAYTYALRPTSEYRLTLLPDRVQWNGSAVDTTSSPTHIGSLSQIVPNPAKNFKIRLRARNNKGLTVPTAQIISVAKSGSTTATVVTDRPHGLAVGDQINAYGVRDQTNFVNISTTTSVASIVNTTTFTIVWGAVSATATSYGGLIAKVQGQQSVQGMAGQTGQKATVANNFLSLNMSSAVTGLVTGDYANVWGCRDAVNGLTSLGLDGVYRVRNVYASNPYTVELEPLDGRTLPATSAVNCGAALIKRTDLRLSFVRLFDYERERVEIQSRPTGDGFGAVPINLVAFSAATPVGTNNIGNVSYSIPTIVADITSAAITTTTISSIITPSAGTECGFQMLITGVTGTNPTLDVVVQESDDYGTTWFDIYHFPRITATMAAPAHSPKIVLKGNRIRYVRTVGGTTPSFTCVINRIQGNSPTAVPQRRIFDRTMTSTQTLAANTASVLTYECKNFQLTIYAGAITTTAPAFKLVGSNDNGATWFDISTALTAVASSTVQLTVANINAELVRATVSTAGSGATINAIEIKAF